MLRVALLSDLHITVPPPLSAYFDRRLSGALNLCFGRRRGRWDDARACADRAITSIKDAAPELIVFAGDASSLADPRELAEGARRLGPLLSLGVPCVALAGNHDRYTKRAERERRFEVAFQGWHLLSAEYEELLIQGERVGFIDTARANFALWDSRGAVIQLPAKTAPTLFAHYGLMRADGDHDHRWHGLREGPQLRQALASMASPITWCSGHLHHGFEAHDGALTQLTAPALGDHGAWRLIEIEAGELKSTSIIR